MCGSIEIVRHSILAPHGAFYFRDLTADGLHLIFIASNKFSIEKEVHYLRRDAVWGYYKPYRFVAWLSGVGKSSFAICQNMYDHHSGQKLYSATTRFVYIDRHTRKSCELPDWFITCAKEFLNKTSPTTNHALQKNSVIPMPREVFSYKIKALQSDCDKNAHVNQAAYLKWCSDVGALAADLRKYPYFEGDIGMYALEEISVKYIGETLVDETVVVHTWVDPNEVRTVHFVIEKKEKVVLNAELKYYDEASTADFSHMRTTKMQISLISLIGTFVVRYLDSIP